MDLTQGFSEDFEKDFLKKGKGFRNVFEKISLLLC